MVLYRDCLPPPISTASTSIVADLATDTNSVLEYLSTSVTTTYVSSEGHEQTILSKVFKQHTEVVQDLFINRTGI